MAQRITDQESHFWEQVNLAGHSDCWEWQDNGPQSWVWDWDDKHYLHMAAKRPDVVILKG